MPGVVHALLLSTNMLSFMFLLITKFTELRFIDSSAGGPFAGILKGQKHRKSVQA